MLFVFPSGRTSAFWMAGMRFPLDFVWISENCTVSEITKIVGDVRGKTAVIVDDICDTAGSLVQCANAVMEDGATRALAAISHPVFSGPALKRIDESRLERVIVTDTIPPRPDVRSSEKIEHTTVSHLLGEAIRRIHNEESVSSLFV